MQSIVIAGGGVGGLELTTRLGRRLGSHGKARIVLVDRSPTHFWKPLLHSVAAGTVDPDVHYIDYVRQALDNGFEFICGDVVAIDRAARRVTVRRHSPQASSAGLELDIHYDELVLSFGAVTNFYGVPGAAEHAISLDTVEQAEQFRKRFLDRCVAAGALRTGQATRATHDAPNAGDAAAPLIDIVIVGGGATGVELAADLRYTVDTLVRYRVSDIDFKRDVRIRIVERAPRLLSALDPAVSSAANRKLASLGIDICTDTAVSEVTDSAVLTTDGRSFPSAITVWAAGVKGPPLCARLGLALNRNDQILVNERLQTLDDPHIYAMGDCSSMVDTPTDAPVPPSAQAARQQAIYLADLLVRLTRQKLPAFRFRDYGALISFGPFGAVGILLRALGRRNLRVRGLIAQMMYAFSYHRYVMANLGLGRMLGQMLARRLRERTVTPVKWH